ncbi:MAG: MFS transporter [Desulfuromonadales bacterium]|nr:MFS transporter [Desulfuromonadales bacterium]
MLSTPDEKARFGWCMYDWANSAFATVILAAVLPVYFAGIAPTSGIPVFWSVTPLPATAFWGYTVSLSMALVALVAPALGNLADRRGWRRGLLIAFCLLGSLATAALVFAGPGRYLLAATLFVLGNIGFAGGNIFYNAFLPTLATGPAADRLSARGYAYGYIGGGLMLALVFLMVQKHSLFGLPDPASATRLGFLLTGLWWLVFAVPTFAWVREKRTETSAIAPLRTPRDYLRTLRALRDYPDLLRFLLAFLLYNDGIQTIIAISAIFAREELGLGTGTIFGCFLMIQFVAMPGALLFARLANRYGTKPTVLVSLGLFLLITIYASTMRTATEFWLLGFAVALVLGGSQALSRSLFATMLPVGRSAEFFSFFAISAKFASIFGPLTFALLVDLTDSNRVAISALTVFFLVGIALLSRVDVQRGQAVAAASH